MDFGKQLSFFHYFIAIFSPNQYLYEWKRWIAHFCFQGLENQKNLESFCQNLTEGELTYLHVIDMSLLSGAIYKKRGEQLRSIFTMEHNRNLQRFVFFTNLSNKCICSFLFYLNHSFGLLMFSVSCWSIVEYMLHWCLLRGFIFIFNCMLDIFLDL